MTGLTKRAFLNRLGQVAGAGVLYSVMEGLGHVHIARGATRTPLLPANQPGKKTVVILGGGIAGLSAAYELTQAGYDCRVLEASNITGGRSRTVRRGDTIAESGAPMQRCAFDPGLYFNTGPARIPSAHRAVLSYCKAFDIKLEVFINDNRSALFQDDRVNDGYPVQARQVHHNSAGLISELLAKAINKDALDDELGDIDRQKLLAFVDEFGELRRGLTYRGGGRAGYAIPPGALWQKGRVQEPLELQDLLSSDFWRWKMHFEKEYFEQATMFQPAGGMDAIVNALTERLDGRITKGAEVTEYYNTETGVQVTFKTADAKQSTITADYCICTIPLKVLAGLKTNLSNDHSNAIRSVSYAPTVKVAYQADRRFWEEDEAIYGGISYVNHPITQMWYPCSDYHSGKGVLVGAYAYFGHANRLAALEPEARHKLALKAGTKVHPQVADETGHPISVAWAKMPFTRGGWADWRENQRTNEYMILSEPDRNIYFAGEHMSWLNGWQEGAVLSAHAVVSSIHERAMAEN